MVFEESTFTLMLHSLDTKCKTSYIASASVSASTVGEEESHYYRHCTSTDTPTQGHFSSVFNLLTHSWGAAIAEIVVGDLTLGFLITSSVSQLDHGLLSQICRRIIVRL